MIESSLLRKIADSVGTPAYVYDAGAIRRNYRRIADAMQGLDSHIHFAVKSNSNLSVLALLRELGAGADIVSVGELHRCLQAGFGAGEVVFGGVGKTDVELETAVELGVGLINVESAVEVDSLEKVAAAVGRKVDIGLRVNPDVTVETHPYTSTGHAAAKFGIPMETAAGVAMRCAASSNLSLRSVGVHIGSQITSPAPYIAACNRTLELVSSLRRSGVESLTDFDIGGGFGIAYPGEDAIDLASLFGTVAPLLRQSGLRVLAEPGRVIVGDAGYLLSSVIRVKRSGGTDFAVLDAAMNDLLRPSLYGAAHGLRVVHPAGTETRQWDFVGPVCESGDFLALARRVSGVGPGALVALEQAGAYGFSMSSNYNSRARAAEVIVDEGRFRVVRKREMIESVFEPELNLPGWESA